MGYTTEQLKEMANDPSISRHEFRELVLKQFYEDNATPLDDTSIYPEASG
ncbi:hypothetical protein GR160_03025 [Flavobacterium sp. Sd200]|nr:hypothetical protein [Flavobacterium sp. Sd200]MXN90187.1 hypothetical protein [Flavobacterium sp. Sd200]